MSQSQAVAEPIESFDTASLSRAAEAAESRGEWRDAADAWRGVLAREPISRGALLGLGRAAREAGDYDAADETLARAMDIYPLDAEIFANHAQVPAKSGDWAAAAQRWRAALAQFSALDVCANLAAEAFRRAGALDEAERTTEAALKTYPDRLDIRVVHATIAESAGRWDDAVARWDIVLQAMPDNIVVRDARGAAIWNAGLQKTEDVQVARRQRAADMPEAEDAATRLKRLMLKFEGLGDNCEFGLVQRHFGAEPLGLLRFTGLYPSLLLELLEEQFARLGDPAHTHLLETDSGELMIDDDRGYYRMHTFVKKGETVPEKLLGQQIKRINFLKRELLEDLRSGEKLYVCKQSEQAIEDATLNQISRRLNDYGDNILVGVRVADAAHAPGSVFRLSEKILVGHVRKMFNQAASSLHEIDFASWQMILETAYGYKQTGAL